MDPSGRSHISCCCCYKKKRYNHHEEHNFWYQSVHFFNPLCINGGQFPGIYLTVSMNPDTNQYYFIRFPNFYGIYIHGGLCFQAHTDYLYRMTEKEKRSAI